MACHHHFVVLNTKTCSTITHESEQTDDIEQDQDPFTEEVANPFEGIVNLLRDIRLPN